VKRSEAQNTPDFQERYARYRSSVDRRLAAMIKKREPDSVYTPIRYVLTGGGKRVRSVILLLCSEAVGGDARPALPAAVAIEILHNFTLVHDDLMDHAGVRRGRPTVHTRWSPDVAILAGDELVAQAYGSLLQTNAPVLGDVLRTFTGAFVDVCEGQGFDKEFELRKDVSVKEYLLMIRKKTARIISAAAQIGGLIGGGTPRQVEALGKFGEHLGMAFQIKDDLLDITGNEDELGKTIGSDVTERKKTYLMLTALELADKPDRAFLHTVLNGNGRPEGYIGKVREIYARSGTLDAAARAVEQRTGHARRSLAALPPGKGREMLLWLSHRLVGRDS
jgi:geranylgeranyl diphosphate synthase type II